MRKEADSWQYDDEEVKVFHIPSDPKAMLRLDCFEIRERNNHVVFGDDGTVE